MLRWLQRWLNPIHRRSAESLLRDSNDQPVVASNREWLVELDGRPVALLTDPKWEDMFWTSYKMTPLIDEPEILAKLNDVKFWEVCESFGVVFHHRFSAEIATYAFPGMDPFPEPGRLMMRGLY